MICPKCAFEKTKVISTIKSTVNERWRKCPQCGATFVTVEIVKIDNDLKKYVKEILKEDDERK